MDRKTHLSIRGPPSGPPVALEKEETSKGQIQLQESGNKTERRGCSPSRKRRASEDSVGFLLRAFVRLLNDDDRFVADRLLFLKRDRLGSEREVGESFGERVLGGNTEGRSLGKGSC